MQFTIREKNPGPQLFVKKNGEAVMESGKPQTEEQVKMAQGTVKPVKK